MKIRRIISSLLAVLMLMSAFTLVMSADEVQYEYNTSNEKPTITYFDGTGVTAKLDKDQKPTGEYESDGVRQIYTKEDKLDSMDLRFAKDGYELYVDAYSGEVATRCVATGEILFSNPYNVADSTAQDSIKKELMSQIVVKYTDIATGDENTYHSYEWAASRGQIVVRNIENGIRVEYTIGREEARMLVPRQIEKSAFETKILNILEVATAGDAALEFQLKKLMAYYILQDPSTVSATYKAEMEKKYPITKKMAIYTLDSSTAQTEMAKIEQMIKTYCPDYSYEDLDEDHMKTEYEAEDKNPPLFKMALEYSLDKDGMTVRLPANGIRFNEALYQLYSVEILPYMGTGANSNKADSVFSDNTGYTFFPDGSGSLFDFNKITDIGSSTTVTGKVYGQDFAYHTITGTHQEVIRYPVFGIVKTENTALIEKKKADDATVAAGGEVDAEAEVTPKYESSGFVAIVEEGDALMELSTYHAVRTSEYNTVKMTVYPRPQDTYNVADAISVGSNDTWTVVSSRKYTGNYKIRYIMLTDDTVAEEKQVENYYTCDYTGMAKAYREYLEAKGTLTRLTDEEVGEDVPLYIETFGAIDSTEKFLSIPVDVMAPLTTFDDIETMYNELSAKGIENINFILTGYTKGGFSFKQAPYNLKWENAVSDKVEFEDLVAYAKEKGFGVYPDFDFAYAQSNKMFDGLTLKDHGVKTIDDRYTTKREYSATKQTYISYFDIAISPAYFSHFYEKLTDNYLKYEPIGISVSTLGSALNSDFDEDEPYNREDSKNFTVKAFEYLDGKYGKVMTSGGNAYTWKYVDYITDVSLDSSRFAQASASVPFLGMVLHGYVETAGTPVNMEGNIDYAILKAIENGASLKFILSYQNTNILKNYEDTSKYYSVRYDIWFDDVVEIYSELNKVLAGVQTSTIDKHEFIDGIRIPDNDELINDANAAMDAAIENAEAYKKAQDEAEKDAYRNARLQIEAIAAEIEKLVAGGTLASALTGFNDACITVDVATFANNLTTLMAAVEAKKIELDAVTDKTSQDYATAEKNYNDAKAAVVGEINLALLNLQSVATLAELYLDEVVKYSDMITLATGEYRDLVEADTKLDATKKAALLALADSIDKNAACANNDLAAEIKVINDKVSGIHADLCAELAKLEGEGKHFAAGELQNVLTAPVAYEREVVEETVLEAPEKVETTEYKSDDSKIVYEVYENGTTFLLNFNNYTVRVALEDGTTYTIEAYGYVVLKQGN